MTNFCVYSHTDYIDILRIQTDYVFKASFPTVESLLPPGVRGYMTLFINKCDYDEHADIFLHYDRVVFYDDTKPYASRLLECLNQITDKYILLIHDIDILLNIDYNTVNQFYRFLEDNSYDRVDLKYTNNFWSPLVVEWPDHDIRLVKNDNIGDYIYNVNPSIWNRESFIKMLNIFPDKTYRDIECHDVQVFCQKNFNTFRLNSSNLVRCGYFACVPQFQFLHISHGGKLLPLNSSFITHDGQSYADIKDIYIDILQKYKPVIGKTV